MCPDHTTYIYVYCTPYFEKSWTLFCPPIGSTGKNQRLTTIDYGCNNKTFFEATLKRNAASRFSCKHGLGTDTHRSAIYINEYLLLHLPGIIHIILYTGLFDCLLIVICLYICLLALVCSLPSG